MGEEIWGFRIAEILVKCEIKGIFIGLNFTDSGIIYNIQPGQNSTSFNFSLII